MPDPTTSTPKVDLNKLMVELRPRLHRYCARMVGSVIDGEDVVQETLVKALNAADHDATIEKPDQWLFRIAHNAAQDFLRRRAREKARMTEAETSTIEDEAEAADRRYIAGLGLKTFMRLQPGPRSAVILADVLELSLNETCEVTGATLAATKAALHRGREQLRTLAATQDDAPPLRLDSSEERLLRAYIDSFNDRDFDAVRALVAEDVRLDLVNRTRMAGKAQVSNYFGNYSRADDWVLSLGFVDGRPAILSHDPESGALRGFMLINWREGEVADIRDFRYAPYALEGAEVHRLGDPA